MEGTVRAKRAPFLRTPSKGDETPDFCMAMGSGAYDACMSPTEPRTVCALNADVVGYSRLLADDAAGTSEAMAEALDNSRGTAYDCAKRDLQKRKRDLQKRKRDLQKRQK